MFMDVRFLIEQQADYENKHGPPDLFAWISIGGLGNTLCAEDCALNQE